MEFFSIETIAFEIIAYPISYVELIATLFGLICVYYASVANIWTWPTGIVNEFFLFLLFFQIQLYADMFLQVYFFIVTLYGWYNWNRQSKENKIIKTSFPTRLYLLGSLIIGTMLVGFLIKNIHLYLPNYFQLPADYPYVDSFIMVASIIATVLLAQKRIENWYLWITIDVVCTVLYYKKGVYFLSLEYFIFLGIASFGLYNWKKQYYFDKRKKVKRAITD